MEPVRALLFGITVAAPIGPIALLLVHTGLNHELGPALRGALGVALADLTYAVIALTIGASLAAMLSAHRHELQLISSLLLLGLGACLALTALHRSDQVRTKGGRAPGIIRLYLLTLANPLTVVLFVGFSGQLNPTRAADAAVDALLLFLGSLMVQTAYAGFGAVLQRWLTDARTIRSINVLCGIGIALFGLYGTVQALM